nr:class II heat shock protein [Tanacetum cinerariifolium]
MEKLAQQQVATFQAQFDTLRAEVIKGTLSKLLQLGTVEDYQQEFEKLMNRVTDILESLLISFYISRLKLNLQRELLVSKPTMIGDAFSLACETWTLLDLSSSD